MELSPELLTIINQSPTLLVFIVGVFVWREAMKVSREQREWQEARDKEWREFLERQGRECREWNDRQSAASQAWQLEMAKTIDNLADKVGSVETKLDLIIAKQYGTGQLGKKDDRPGRGL